MSVGHARCAVDVYFGLIKQKWRTSENDTLHDVEKVINELCAPNFAVIHNWPWMEWDSWLLQNYLPVRGILKFQHFLFSKDDLLNIQCRTAPESEPTVIRILKHGVESPTDPSILPEVLTPAGLSPHCLQYLDKEVAPYVSAGAQDSQDQSGQGKNRLMQHRAVPLIQTNRYHVNLFFNYSVCTCLCST